MLFFGLNNFCKNHNWKYKLVAVLSSCKTLSLSYADSKLHLKEAPVFIGFDLYASKIVQRQLRTKLEK